MNFGIWYLAKMARFIGVVVVLVSILGTCEAAGTVVRSIYVNRNSGADFKSIQEAVNSVPFGNDQWIRVHVAGGIYK
jgi:pectin methylesterase-like acyl-CoA thioesterase